ncbi:MAG TPA: response regulator, partial [Terriglobia bacterium]|nr:response regulator [Terriglobia bacterium]
METKVLIVDDEQTARDLCVEILHRMGFQTETAESGARALEVMEREPVDIVLTDVRMPGRSGIELLKIIRQKYPETDVVMMTGFGTIQASVEAIKLGAYDYLTKPF